MSRTAIPQTNPAQQPSTRAIVRGVVALLCLLAACESEKPGASESATVLARHIDQLLDNPAGLPRAPTTSEQAADATSTGAPAVATPAQAGPDARAADVEVDVPAIVDVPAAAAAMDADATAADVQATPDVVAHADAAAGRIDAAMAPIVPIPVHRDGTPIALPPGVVKPDAKLTPNARHGAQEHAVAAKPTLTAAERRAQAKAAAIAAKAEAKAAAKKALVEKKKKAQGAARERKKRAAAAKLHKLEAKKAAILARKAAAWARKHPHGHNPYAPKAAKPSAGKQEAEPATEKAKPAKSPKPDVVKPEPVKPQKPAPETTLAPTKGEPLGDATELFFSGKRKQDAGDFNGAIDDFKASQAARPSPRTLTALGRAYFDAGEMNAAASVLRQAGHQDDAQLLLGTLYQQMDKPEKARKVYEEFLKAHPDHAKADWVRKLLKTL